MEKKGGNSGDSDWIGYVREVVRAVRESDATEVDLSGTFNRRPMNIHIKRRSTPHVPKPQQHQETPPETQKIGIEVLTAPLTGIFYRGPKPDHPYVLEGEHVEPNTVIGMVECMKNFNEVTADYSGVVVRIKAIDGKVIHAGDSIMEIDTTQKRPTQPGV